MSVESTHKHFWFCVCFFSLVYGVFGANTVQASDTSEFLLLATHEGLPHPPGYPWLISWFRLFHLLPVFSSVHCVSIANGCISALALGVLWCTLHHYTQDKSVSYISVGLLAVQPLWFRYSTVPEAFSLLALEYAILGYLFSVSIVSRRDAWLFGGCLALIVGGHHAGVFAFPMILLLLYRYRRWFVDVVGISLLGVVVYTVLWDFSDTREVSLWSWGYIDSVDTWFRHIMREDYGSLRITHASIQGEWWETPRMYLYDWSVDSWGIFPIVLVYLVWQMVYRGAESKWHATKVPVVLGTWLLASVVLLTLFRLPISKDFLVHSNRFFMAPGIIIMPLIAMGLQNISRRIPFLQYGLTCVVLAFFAGNWILAGRFDKRMSHFIEHSCANFPDNSIVFVRGDGAVFSLLYAQEVQGMCQQVNFVFPSMLGYTWYQQKISAQGFRQPSTQNIMQDNISTRPIFVSLGMTNDGIEFSTVPWLGLWMQVLPEHTAVPSPQMVEEHLQQSMHDLDVSFFVGNHFLQERVAESWVGDQYYHSWLSVATAYRNIGDTISAQRCVQMAESFRQ